MVTSWWMRAAPTLSAAAEFALHMRAGIERDHGAALVAGM